jgi:hypothetical protein
MFKYTIAAVAALGVLAGGPALASGKVKSDAGVTKNQQTAAASGSTRYCYLVPASTGTIIDRKVCKTLDQWRAEGVDPTKPQNN